MTVTVPLFLQSGDYDAIDFRLGVTAMFGRPTSSLTRPGGVIPGYAGQLAVSQAGPSMNVTVASGAASISGAAGQGNYVLVNKDSTATLPIEASTSTARVDLIVARLKDVALGDPAGTPGTLEVVKGTPGGGAPTIPSGMSAVGIAAVTVRASTVSILTADIADVRPWAVAPGGLLPCLSTARPADPYRGMEIYETDTSRKARWTGGAWLYSPFVPAYLELTRLNSSFQAIASGGAFTKVLWNRVPHFSGFTPITPPLHTITVQNGYDGVYLITASAAFADGTAGDQRAIRLYLNDDAVVEDRRPPITAATIPTALTLSATWNLNVGDEIYLGAYQDSGSAQDLGYGAMLPRMTMFKLSD